MMTQMEDCGVTVTNPVLVIWSCVTTRTVPYNGFILTAYKYGVHPKESGIAHHVENQLSLINRRKETIMLMINLLVQPTDTS